jgi:hypothetical protein
MSQTLPFHWTARSVIVQPSLALRCRPRTHQGNSLCARDRQHFELFPHRPPQPLPRTGPVRLRRAFLQDRAAIVVEGTLTLPERRSPPARCPLAPPALAEEALDLYGYIDRDSLAFAESVSGPSRTKYRKPSGVHYCQAPRHVPALSV